MEPVPQAALERPKGEKFVTRLNEFDTELAALDAEVSKV